MSKDILNKTKRNKYSTDLFSNLIIVTFLTFVQTTLITNLRDYLAWKMTHDHECD